MKINPRKNWDSVLRQTRAFLKEDSSSALKPREEETSIDSQIDRYFSDYESEAKLSKKESKNWRATVRRIVEAEDDADIDVDLDADLKKEIPLENIDISSFTNGVMRLIENYDSLLEVRNTILRRAINFLSENYSEEVIDALKDSLKSEHGVEIGKSKNDMEDDVLAPAAAGAGSLGAAGGA